MLHGEASLGAERDMTPEQYERVRQIFLAVRNLPESHRVAYLDKACHGDPALRTEVEAFVAAQDKAGGFIDTPALGPDFGLGRQTTLDAIDGVPTQIGRYRILEVIARGGMGVVYLAERGDDGERVALKVMRPDMVSPEIVRRFEHEGRILAMLKHHGMAQIYEVDTFDAGLGLQPFMAMEYVRGVPLLEYANYQQVSINDRLTLMMKICAAIQYSHHKGVIHRDLKPSNILVDQSGQPKIVDFGIARITDADIHVTQATATAEAGQVLGTLPYMSPEQCDPDPHALDTRSDVYSLGVVCYELLTGHLPYDLGDSILQAVRSITTTPPTPMHSYNAFINEDLDRIVMKALAKDKEQRIQSAADFSEELARFLRGEAPLTVRLQPRPSRFRRLASEHRVLAACVLAVTLVAVGFLAGHFAGGLGRDSGPAPMTDPVLVSSLEALVQEVIASVADAGDDASIDRLVEALNDAARLLDVRPPAPSTEASLRRTLAAGFRAADRPGSARRQLLRSYNLSRRLFGPEDERTHAVQVELNELTARSRDADRTPPAGPDS